MLLLYRVVFLLVLFLILPISCRQNQASENEADGEKVMTDKFFEGDVMAPDFPEHLEWLNTDRSFSLEDFRGKVVLLDFWTFCCINCMHILPDLKKLERKYPEELVVIGVHSAKFTNEKDTEAIRQAILRYEIKHAVVNDNNFEIWSAYGARAWPTLVLINPEGYIIGGHSGEGIYEKFDRLIGQTVEYFERKGTLRRGPLNLALEETGKANTLLSFPGKVKADEKKGRLFITDSNNNRILISDPQGRILDVIGSGRVGRSDGSFETAEFNHPQGTFPDGDILYIADTENHLIRAANLKTRTVETILGTGGQARMYNFSGRGREAPLNSPWDLLVDDGKLYIAMAGSHQLWAADLQTLEAAPYAGSAREARIDGLLLHSALAQPSGITTDGRRLYFADSETSSIRSADLKPDGRVETIIGEDLFEYGDIDGGWSVARMQHPLGIVHKGGLLYVADTYNSKIKVVDPKKKTSTTLAGSRLSGYRDGKLQEALFNEPSGITVLGDKLYVADANNHQIRVIDLKDGAVTTMEFTGLEKLARRRMDNFSGRLVEYPSQKIGEGNGVIVVLLSLPEGYKFTKDAPFHLTWKSGDDNIVRFQSNPDEIDAKGTTFPYELPVSASLGEGEIILDAVVYFCQDNSSACLFDNIRVRIPIEVNNRAPERIDISLEVVVPPVI
jgi:thiol-disulfide isomerase/thioredoxin